MKMTDRYAQLFDAIEEVDIINFAIKQHGEARDQKKPAFLSRKNPGQIGINHRAVYERSAQYN